MFLYRAVTVVSALCLLAGLPATLVAQAVRPTEGIAAAERLAVSQAALQHLRSADPEQALQALAAAAEWNLPLSLAEDDPQAPACAGLHRALAQLSSEERFDLLLKWSLPAESPPRIRVLTAIVPTAAPPVELARALGERPRATSFATASIGDVRGIFSTAWSLVAAAHEAGRLRRLMTDLEPLVEKKVPHADLLMTLAQLADARGEAAKLTARLTERTQQLKATLPATGAGPTTIDPTDVVLAAAALSHPALRAASEELFETLVASTYGQPAPRVRPFLRQAHAIAVLKSRGDVDAAPLLTNRLKHWVPVSGNGSRETTWLAQEDHLLHLSGSGDDVLLFRYPLTGDFAFHGESQTSGRIETDGGLVYGGLHFQALSGFSEFSLWNTDGTVLGKRPCPFQRQFVRPTFNRWSLTSTPDAATVAVNLHPMWVDAAAQASPWLGLRSFDERRPLFRNLRLTGRPVIPREVRLSDGDILRGWQAQDSSDRQPKTVPAPTTTQKAVPLPAWQLAAGVIQAAKQDADGPAAPLQPVLSYQRPLLSHETISYEFFYEPRIHEVSPALGRVAFLLQPDGVRLRWVTAGEQEWTGLVADNAVVEPLNRRGPKPLPFQVNAWNRMTLARTEQALTLSLNDVVIYQRPIDWHGDHRFGLYRPDDKVGVQVRNVVLTGDWPETLPSDVLDQLTATTGEPLPVGARHALNQIVRDEFLAENVFAIRRRALALPVAERFESLAQSILPGPDHAGFRLAGDFLPTQPAPAAVDPSAVHPNLGGELVSPVFDWLDAARELGRLAECRHLVDATPMPTDEYQQRARAALLMLLDLELGDQPAVTRDCETLFTLLKTQTPASIEDQWPETLVLARGVRKFAESVAVAELLTQIHAQRTQQWRPGGINLWHAHIAAMVGRQQFLKAGGTEAAFATPPKLTDWIPASGAKASTRGQGYPPAFWQRSDNSVSKITGHDDDFLFYRLPLSGNYEVECDLKEPSHHPSQILLGGIYVGPRWDLKFIETGTFRAAAPHQPMEPPFSRFGPWVHYRGVIRDGLRTVYLNGRQVHSEPLPEHADPWIAIRCWSKQQGSVQDFRVTGRPTVLAAVPLSSSKDLSGWISYHEEAVAQERGRWLHVDDPESTGWIVGRAGQGLAGTFSEGLLRYQRPLVEDGTIEYEFFYKPGKFEAHPALDRLAFLVTPTGIREHWITDGRYNRTEITPDNSTDVPQNRRGPAELPLRPGAWNRLMLKLRGNTVAIELNAELVYERALEPTNQRTFGLFHYVDSTEVRVRNALMRGDWPKSLPSVADQELAGTMTDALDADLPRLKAVFRHSFEQDGVPDKYFKMPSLTAGKQVFISPHGVHVIQPAMGSWVATDILPRFALHGDFDIEARFSQLQASSDKDAGVMLIAAVDEPRKPHYRTIRMRTAAGRQETHASLSLVQADGSRSYHTDVKPSEAINGRLRLARRGDKVHFLFAEEDSNFFRLIGTEAVASGTSTERDGVRLQALCNGVGTTNVVWKSVVLRAERMTWYPDVARSEPLVLRVVQPDGRGLKTLITPEAAGFSHLGSPEWSADSRQIVLDMSDGSTTNSHVIVINPDGSGLKDLGLGCMPSFSGDGKRIVFSLPGQGVVMMNSDGSDRQVLEANAWGTQWSPDGKLIAYIQPGNITLLDVATRKTRSLLVGEAATRYDMIYWNLGWSHDSRSLAFKARRPNSKGDELAVIDIHTPNSFKIILPEAKAASPDCTWSPDNQQVVVSIQNPSVQGPQLYAISRKQPGPPQMLPAQPPAEKVYGGDWSHDGKTIVIASQKVSQAVEWLTDSEPAPPAE